LFFAKLVDRQFIAKFVIDLYRSLGVSGPFLRLAEPAGDFQ